MTTVALARSEFSKAKKVYVDTRYRDSTPGTVTSVSDFTYTLSRPINDIRGFAISNVAMSNSIYTLNATNNTIVIGYVGPILTSVNIPVGFYDANTLATQLQTSLNDSLGPGWTVAFSTTSYKYTITSPQLYWIDNTSTIGDVIGFPIDGYLQQPSSTVYTSNSLVKIDGPDYLFITSTALGFSVDSNYMIADDKQFTISSSNNAISLSTETDIKVNFTIPSATYNLTTLIKTVRNQLIDILPSVGLETTDIVFSMDEKTNITMFTNNLGIGIKLNKFASTAAVLLGYGKYIETYTTGNIVATQPMNLSVTSSIIKKVLINKPVTKVVFSEGYNDDEIIFYSKTVNSIVNFDIQVRYPNESIADLNGVNWSFDIVFFN